MSDNRDAELSMAHDFLKFKNGIPSQFHTVLQAKKMFDDAGFVEISEKKDSDFQQIKPNGKYYFSRNQSTIFAFAVGGKWTKGNGFCIQAAHTDSPVPKVKPVSNIKKHGFLQVGCEMYGGGLWNTWFDRDLSLAGRVIVSNGDGTFESKLVCIPRPILYIPNLAIHLNRTIYSEGFKPNKETHVCPVLATVVKNQLNQKSESGDKPDHHPLLLQLLADELKIDTQQIRDFELCLYDTQPASLGGACNEFILSRGLDNLMMSFVTTRSLIDSCSTLASESLIRVVALFDNEEIGSRSCMGAASDMMGRVLMRINQDAKSFDSAMRKSVLISADMAHALHPNYAEKHESNHRPSMHKGLVIKQNCNQRYATTSITSFLLCEIARKHNIPVQKFVVRNDVGCGSTIGPILSANTSIRTVDVGIAQLAMHSVREMCGTADCLFSVQLCTAFFNEFSQLDANLKNQN